MVFIPLFMKRRLHVQTLAKIANIGVLSGANRHHIATLPSFALMEHTSSKQKVRPLLFPHQAFSIMQDRLYFRDNQLCICLCPYIV